MATENNITIIGNLSKMFSVIGYLMRNQQYDKVNTILSQLSPNIHRLEMCVGVARITSSYHNRLSNWDDLVIRIYNETRNQEINREELLMGLLTNIDKKLLK